MIKHVHVSQLKVGMFVHHLYCPWLNHPLDRHNYLITSEEQIEKIAAAGLYEVYIDTKKGLDAPDTPTLKQTVSSLEAEMTEMAGGYCILPMRTTLAEEMERARTIKDRAQQLIREVIQDARLGNMISLGGIEPVIRDITDSILRNPGHCPGFRRSRTRTTIPSCIPFRLGQSWSLFALRPRQTKTSFSRQASAACCTMPGRHAYRTKF